MDLLVLIPKDILHEILLKICIVDICHLRITCKNLYNDLILKNYCLNNLPDCYLHNKCIYKQLKLGYNIYSNCYKYNLESNYTLTITIERTTYMCSNTKYDNNSDITQSLIGFIDKSVILGLYIDKNQDKNINKNINILNTLVIKKYNTIYKTLPFRLDTLPHVILQTFTVFKNNDIKIKELPYIHIVIPSNMQDTYIMYNLDYDNSLYIKYLNEL